MKKFLQRIARHRFVVSCSVLVLLLIAVFFINETRVISLELLLTLVALLLTVTALFVAVRQLRQGREMAKILKDLSQSVSTEYVGAFPEFMPMIVKLLGMAEKKVKIMCDIPAYGNYSNHKEYLRYFAALADLNAREVHVRLTVYTEEKEREALAVQFDEPFEKLQNQNLEEYRKQREGKEEIKDIDSLRESLAS